jgi:hypothetical protein
MKGIKILTHLKDCFKSRIVGLHDTQSHLGNHFNVFNHPGSQRMLQPCPNWSHLLVIHEMLVLQACRIQELWVTEVSIQISKEGLGGQAMLSRVKITIP